MRVTGLEKTIANLTKVRDDLKTSIAPEEAKISKLEQEKKVIDTELLALKGAIAMKKATIEEIEKTLSGLTNLDKGITTPTELPVEKLEEA